MYEGKISWFSWKMQNIYVRNWTYDIRNLRSEILVVVVSKIESEVVQICMQILKKLHAISLDPLH